MNNQYILYLLITRQAAQLGRLGYEITQITVICTHSYITVSNYLEYYSYTQNFIIYYYSTATLQILKVLKSSYIAILY